MDPPGGGGVLAYKSVCRPMLKRRGLTELIKLKKWLLSELKPTVKVVPLELIELGKMGAFRKIGCF